MKTLDPARAYLATDNFMEAVWERTNRPEEFGLFVGFCGYLPGVGTSDPAAWYDWLAWVQKVQTGTLIPDDEWRGDLTADSVAPLTPEQGYLALYSFIEEYWLRVSKPPDIGPVLERLEYTPGVGPADPELWALWLKHFEEAAASPPLPSPQEGSG